MLDADAGSLADNATGTVQSESVVLGDLNVAPADIDVWDPHRYRSRNLTSPPEREAFAQLLAGDTDDPTTPRLADIVRRELGEEHGYSWWNRRGDFYDSDRGWRLDHILASPGIAATAQNLAIDRGVRGQPGSSDHAPMRVDFNI